MTGFKSGNTDLWGDEDDERENESDDDTTTEDTSMSQSESERSRSEQRDNIPYITRRRSKDEATTWQRSRVTFYVREEFEDGERELKNAVENILGEEISKFDLREAAYGVAQEQPGAVAEMLEEMGVGYEL